MAFFRLCAEINFKVPFSPQWSAASETPPNPSVAEE